MVSKLNPGQKLFAELKIEIDEVAIEYLHHYTAIEYYLNIEDDPKPDSDILEQVKSFLETLYHLCGVRHWQRLQKVINFPMEIDTIDGTMSSMVFSEYLFFKGLASTMLEISQSIINVFQTSDDRIEEIFLINARALLSTGQLREACIAYQEICLQPSIQEELFIEANSRLAMAQLQAGNYDGGLPKVKEFLGIIDNLEKLSSISKKLKELKTDLLESCAYYQMNSNHYQEAIDLYTQVIEVRGKLGIKHRQISPSIHLGIIMRKIGDYDRAFKYLMEARKQTSQIQNETNLMWIEHHLAYVLLNQGKYLDAEVLCQNATKRYQELSDLRGVSDCHEQMGFILFGRGELDRAEHFFEKGLTIREDIGNIHGTASSLKDLALLAWHQKRYWYFLRMSFKSFTLYYQLGILTRLRFVRMLKLLYTWTVGKRDWTT